MAAMASAYKHSIRIRPIDIIRVPKYERVWQIGSMGQVRARVTAVYTAKLLLHACWSFPLLIPPRWSADGICLVKKFCFQVANVRGGSIVRSTVPPI
jgi:hypothetical protein